MSRAGSQSQTGVVLFAGDVDRVAAFYAAVLGFEETARADDHVVMESGGFQLVVHRAIGGVPTASEGDPPARRASGAFKPVFFVPSVSTLREVIARHGGVIEPPEREWTFQGAIVCDACDPEGNVIQLRARARYSRDSAS
jgi:predicted enzyme related to lactoylglutathione lyase